MKIFTISEPECGGKPTGFASVIKNDNRSTLKEQVVKGLVEAWFFTESMAERFASEGDMDALHECGYLWSSDGRFLFEVTMLDE